MDKTAILETLFETIDESLEWGLGSKDDMYSYYINGVMNMANKLIEKINTENSSTPVEAGCGLGKDSIARTNTKLTKIIDGESLAM